MPDSRDNETATTRGEELYEAARQTLHEGKVGEPMPTIHLTVDGLGPAFPITAIDYYETEPAIISATRADGLQVLFGEDDLRAVLIGRTDGRRPAPKP